MKKALTILLSAVIGVSATGNAQIINTIAGSGPYGPSTGGYDGDGVAISKRLNSPWGVAIDAAQNVYVTDMNNDIIRKITPAGVMTTIGGQAGNSMYMGDEVQATSTTFNTPMGICVDAGGNIYIADQANNKIRKIDPSGVVHTVAGYGLASFSGDNGPATAANLQYPSGVFVTPAGEIYIADYGNSRIRKVDAAGIITTVAGSATAGYLGDGGPATAARMDRPIDVKVDAAGNIFVCEWYHGVLRKINTSGIISTFITAPQRLNSLDIDKSGNVYFTCLDHSAYKSDPFGVYTRICGAGSVSIAGFSGDGGLATGALMYNVAGIAVGPTNDIYMADGDNNRVREISYPVIPVAPITGSSALCAGTTTQLADLTSGGTWSSSNTGIALVDATGLVTGVSAGNAMITYTTTSNFTTFNISVAASGSVASAGKILGLNYACPGTTVILSETMPGGDWSTGNTAISTINAMGLVHAVRPGKTILTYTVMGTCGEFVSLNFPFTTLNYEECTAGVSAGPVAATTAIAANPNPNNGTFTINMISPNDEQVAVTITNVLGQKVKEYTTATNQSVVVKLEGAGGIYFINAVSAQGKWSQKVLVNAAR